MPTLKSQAASRGSTALTSTLRLRPEGSSPPKGKPDPDLPDAELEILACLWKLGPATARQVRQSLHAQRPMAHGSAVTLLRRLESKGLLTREKIPGTNAFLYKPTQKPEPTYRRLVRRLADRVFAGNPVQLVASLFDTKPPTREQLQELQKLLDEMKK